MGPDGDDAVLADSTAPLIEWIAPEAGTEVDGVVILTAYADDDQGIWKMSFYIAGFEVEGVLTDSTGGIYTYSWNTESYREGPYPLMARAKDAARNQSTTPVVIVWK